MFWSWPKFPWTKKDYTESGTRTGRLSPVERSTMYVRCDGLTHLALNEVILVKSGAVKRVDSSTGAVSTDYILVNGVVQKLPTWACAGDTLSFASKELIYALEQAHFLHLVGQKPRRKAAKKGKKSK